jgi:hypothetical protein
MLEKTHQIPGTGADIAINEGAEEAIDVRL